MYFHNTVRDNQHPAMTAAAAGHGFFYPSMWGNSQNSGSFGNSAVSSNGAANQSSTAASQMPSLSPVSTSNIKENRDNNSFDPPHGSPPNSGSSSSPYGYPSSPSKCDVKSVHNIKSEHNFSNRSENTGENFKLHHNRKSLTAIDEGEYTKRTEASPSGGFSPNDNNNHFDSDKDEMANTQNSAETSYENTNRHPSYHYHNQDTSNNSCSSAYSGHTISGAGTTSSGHLMKRPEGTNRTNTHEKGKDRGNENGSFSPVPENEPLTPLPYNSSSINSSVGGPYPYLSSVHQSSPHQPPSLSSPLYGAYSTCGSLFASSKSFHNSSSSSKSKCMKKNSNSSGKNLALKV